MRILVDFSIFYYRKHDKDGVFPELWTFKCTNNRCEFNKIPCYSLLFVVVIRIVSVLDFVLPLPGLYVESIGKVRDFCTTLLVV